MKKMVDFKTYGVPGDLIGEEEEDEEAEAERGRRERDTIDERGRDTAWGRESEDLKLDDYEDDRRHGRK